MQAREKPNGGTPWHEVNQLLLPDERFEAIFPEWRGFLFAPKRIEVWPALLYLLKQKKISFCVQGRGTTLFPSSDQIAILSTRAFSQLKFHESEILTVGAGCTLSYLHRFLRENNHEVNIAVGPLVSPHRSIGGILLSGRTAGIKIRNECLPASILGVEWVTYEGNQLKWGGNQRSCLAGPTWHKLIWGIKTFPGILTQVILKTYALPLHRIHLTWSFRVHQELWNHVKLLCDFATTWERLDVILSGKPEERGFIVAQISGEPAEMEVFKRFCPSYGDAECSDGASRLNQFFNRQSLHAHLTTVDQSLSPGEYLWYHEMNKCAWWLTPQAVKAKTTEPLWKQRLWESFCHE